MALPDFLVIGAPKAGTTEADPVGRPRHRDRVPPAGPDRTAQPVGEIDPVVTQGGARGAGPVAGAGAGRRDHDGGLIGARQQRGSRPFGKFATKHTGILDRFIPAR